MELSINVISPNIMSTIMQNIPRRNNAYIKISNALPLSIFSGRYKTPIARKITFLFRCKLKRQAYLIPALAVSILITKSDYSAFGTIRKLSNDIITSVSASGFPKIKTEKLRALDKSSFKSSFGFSSL